MKVRLSLTSLVAHYCGTYPGFFSMKRIGILIVLLDGMLVHHKLPPSISSGFPDGSLVPIYTPE